jgi:hypothetical protein
MKARGSLFAFLLWAGLPAAPTFHRDIEPILQRHCQGCHRPGEIGRMPLLTYSQVRPWARAIRQSVVTRRMPPWFAARHAHPMANDPRLSDAEIGLIEAWVRAGAPRGRPEEAPPPREFVPGWNIGRPDLIVGMPQAVAVPAKEEIDYVFQVVPLGLAEDRWVRAVEIRPERREVVHHVVVYVREPGSRWLRGDQRRVTTSDILAIYTPGQSAAPLPPGMARKIPAGSDLVFQLHYTPAGKAVTDRTSLGLVFSSEPPEKRVFTLQLGTAAFRIPPGEPNHRVSVSGTLPADALLLSFFPHLHLRGKAFEYERIEPGGRVTTLLRVEPYDFYWQLDYRLRQPLPLPAGTLLRCTAWYDNSANNPRNPDPAAEVVYGEQSRDEMMIGFFDVAVDPALDKEAFFRLRGTAQ